MDEIMDIKRTVYIREIVFAVINGEYSFPINEIVDMQYDEIEDAYFDMADFLRSKRHQVS